MGKAKPSPFHRVLAVALLALRLDPLLRFEFLTPTRLLHGLFVPSLAVLLLVRLLIGIGHLASRRATCKQGGEEERTEATHCPNPHIGKLIERSIVPV